MTTTPDALAAAKARERTLDVIEGLIEAARLAVKARKPSDNTVYINMESILDEMREALVQDLLAAQREAAADEEIVQALRVVLVRSNICYDHDSFVAATKILKALRAAGFRVERAP